MSLIIVLASLIVLLGAIQITNKFEYFSEMRAMTAPIFALTIIPAFYSDLGTSYQIDLMAQFGVSQWWNYAVSWYPAYIITLLIIVKIRQTGQHLTLPDRFMQYSRTAEIISSLVSILYLLPVSVIFSMGLLGGTLSDYGIPLWVFMILFGGTFVAFTAKNGWSGYSLPGILYFLGMTLGVAGTGLILITSIPNFNAVIQSMPLELANPWFTDIGGFISSLQDPAAFIWFMMGFAFLFDPMIWQRISLAESGKAARKGMVYAILFWMCFDIITVYTGYAVFHLGGEGAYYMDTAYAFLPSLWAGIMLAGNLLVMMAGGSAYLHSAGMICSQNIAKALGFLNAEVQVDDVESKNWYEQSVYVLGGIGILSTIILNSMFPDDPVTTIWLVSSGFLIGSIGFPLLFGGLFWRDAVPEKAVNLSMMFGLIVTGAAIVYGLANPNAYGLLTLGITPETATGTPFLDASRVLGFGASAIGWLVGYALSLAEGE